METFLAVAITVVACIVLLDGTKWITWQIRARLKRRKGERVKWKREWENKRRY
jgi:hypothetical protein